MKRLMRVLFVAGLIALESVAADRTWNVTAPGTYEFETAENWTGGSGVDADDTFVIARPASGAVIINVNTAFDIGALTIGGGAGAGTVTLNFKNGFTTNVVSGDVSVGAGGVLTHEAATANAKKYRLNLSCNNLSVLDGGKIHADAKSDGAVTTDTYGGCGGLYGGGICYGSIREPNSLGGKNTYSGGGAVGLFCRGTAFVDGTISSIGQGGGSIQYYTGTGGSILLKCTALSGDGTINATAGIASNNAGGGGGRIALYASAAQNFDAFTGDVKAYGTKLKSGAGTIYYECAADAAGRGTLVIDNSGGFAPAAADRANYCTRLGDATDSREPFGTVIVRNKAVLRIVAGCTLQVTRGFSVDSTSALVSDNNSCLEFVGTEDATVDGTFSLAGLKCAVPGKQISFAAGKTVSIANNGTLTLEGAAGNEIILRSQTDGTAWKLTVGADVTSSLVAVDVADADASAGASVSVVSGTNSGGNSANWIFLGPIQPGDPISWTGVTDTSWTEGSNWNPQRAPVATDVVTIPAGCARYPIVADEKLVNTLAIAAGASLTLNGADLIVTNAFSNAGDVVFAGEETLRFEGNGAQTLDLGNRTYSRLMIAKTGGSVAFANGFTTDFLYCRAVTPLGLVFAAGADYAVTSLTLDGYQEVGEAAQHLLSLSSSASGTAWKLNATDDQRVRGVAVSDCDASAGKTMKVGLFSTDNGLNSDNWDFTNDAVKEWIGGSSTYLTDANWRPAGIPTSNSQVAIVSSSGAATCTLAENNPQTVYSVIIGGEAGASALVANSSLTVGGGISLGQNGTLTLNYFATTNAVTGDVFVHRGGVVTHTGPQNNNNAAANRVNLSVAGNMTIDAGGSVSAVGRGYSSGKGPYGSSGIAGNSHGGVGSSKNLCRGSIREPEIYGPTSGYHSSGGAVKLTVAGTLTVNGTVDASAQYGGNYATSCGGSVWLTAGTFAGSGSVQSTQGSSGNDINVSSGGRIALYQTATAGWNGFAATVSTSGYSGGTYFRRDAAGVEELFAKNSANAAGAVQFPMANDGDARTAYKDTSLSIGANTSLQITNATWVAGSTVKVKDLVLTTTSSKVKLLGSFIKVSDLTHEDGEGWAGTYTALVTEGGGSIIWGTSRLILLLR